MTLKAQIPKTNTEWEMRFWLHVRLGSDDECWPWLAGKTTRGYGVLWIDGKTPKYAHRLAYNLFFGEIPKGLVIDHRCRNSCCVNPSHIEAVTQKTNVRRSPNVGRPPKHGVMCSRTRSDKRVIEALKEESHAPGVS